MRPRPPIPTLFPYTTLFRSWTDIEVEAGLDRRGIARKRGPERQEAGIACLVGHHLPRCQRGQSVLPAKIEARDQFIIDRKSTRLNSSHPSISYAVFCLKKKK